MDHIQYSKNVLDEGTLNNLQQLVKEHYLEIPIYNFSLKTENPKNYLEEVIRNLIGYDHHVEYWVRDDVERTLMHVDANELQAKRDMVQYGEEDIHMFKEFPLNTHILYVDIDPKMEGGKLLLMPDQEYIHGRKILDDSFKVPDGSRILVIKPETNHMVLFDKPLYHAVEAVENRDVVKHRVALMFSAWDKVPSVYIDHLHWTNHMISYPGWPNHLPKDVEFKLTI